MNLRLRRSEIPPHLMKYFRSVAHKPKDLVSIPHMVAEALREWGWFLRCDICWAKPNPMPESVTDRPTKSHEYVFLFSKRARYFFDGEAIREPHVEPDRIQRNSGTRYESGVAAIGVKANAEGNTNGYNPAGRNRRSVWSIVSEPYPEAHFATFPQALVEPMILAGTSAKGVCPACGAQWRRVVEKTVNLQSGPRNTKRGKGLDQSDNRGDYPRATIANETTGWAPSCKCPPAEPVPATILDPFVGSGTTLAVAVKLGRYGIGIDLNAAYLELARKRLAEPVGIGGLFEPRNGIPVMTDLFSESP